MVNHHGLKNLIWVWTSQPNDFEWYPGHEYVDIVGRDIYEDGDHSSQILEFNQLNDMFDGKKIVALTECGSIPDPENLIADEAAWSYFMPWWGDFVRDSYYNSVDFWNELLGHEYVLTLDEMPDLKTYVTSIARTNIQNHENKLKIFPTAVTNELYIQSSGWISNVTVFSLTGSRIQNLKLNSKNAVISLSNYSPGIYLIQIDNFKPVKIIKK
jgi:mannan endo-1,4-beta-mannosidase